MAKLSNNYNAFWQYVNNLNEILEEKELTFEDLVEIGKAVEGGTYQTALTAGEGINIDENNVIKSNIHLYHHTIIIAEDNVALIFSFVISQDVTFTNITSINTFFKDNNLTGRRYGASGMCKRNDVIYPVLAVNIASGLYGNTASYVYSNETDVSLAISVSLNNSISVTDIVTQIL